jgi:hypothetical protein
MSGEWPKLQNTCSLLAVVLESSVSILISCAPATAESIAVKAGKLVDTEACSVLSDEVVLIENSTIKSVGPAAEVSIPK